MSSDADLTTRWAEGWAVSRGTPHPARTRWGLRIEVGAPNQVRRHLLLEPSAAAAADLAATIDEPLTWIKAAVDPSVLRPALGTEWTEDQPGWLMVWDVAPGKVRIPEGYAVETAFADGVTRVGVTAADGSLAARAQYGHRDGFGVVDQVRTEAEHQRRGLGSLMMRTLANAAHERGAQTSILGASVEGRALYEALGWKVYAPLAGFIFRQDAGHAG
jgi:GNAT superfamily N-acetyltransferase